MVQLEVDYGELVRRISGRRTCSDCGRVFNLLTSPPRPDEVCPKTGAPHRLMQRPDDNEATVAERLRVYDEKTRPLIDFYRARGLLRDISAEGDVDEITRRVRLALAQKPGREHGAPATSKPAAAKRKPAAGVSNKPKVVRGTPRKSAKKSTKKNAVRAAKKKVAKKKVAKKKAGASRAKRVRRMVRTARRSTRRRAARR